MSEITQGDYRIYSSSDRILIQHLAYNRILTIEKSSNNIYEVEQNVLDKIVIYGAVKPHAIVGIIKIESIDFLIYVKSCQLVAQIEKSEIFKIQEVELIPLCDDITLSTLNSDIKSLIIGIKNLMTLGFFYSFNYDLTNSKQKQAKFKNSNNNNINNNYSLNENADKKYFWNFNMYKRLNLQKSWAVVLICGYVSSAVQILHDSEIQLTLLSRRSVNHAGTRYITRGIDDDGHVANYCETEQILKYGNHILSFVQVRGSAPVFFQQTGMTASTQITRTPELTSAAFLKHIEEVQKEFQMAYIINLMNVNKPNEQIITQNLESQIKSNNIKSLRYYFYDFQNECKYDNYDNLDNFVQNMENVFNIFKFFCENSSTKEIIKEQAGVFRTNCLDCLDRTNVIQTRIAWRVLELQVYFFYF